MNKLFSILTFIFITFSIFILMHLIQTNQDVLEIKDLHKIVDEEIKQIESFKKKHIDSH
jgi:low affinity Fe/Cu permease